MACKFLIGYQKKLEVDGGHLLSFVLRGQFTQQHPQLPEQPVLSPSPAVVPAPPATGPGNSLFLELLPWEAGWGQMGP